MATLVLVRHGETTWNRERRVQGWAPVGLTEHGREQATRLGEHLAATYDVDRLLSSDLHRSLETARYLRRELPEPPDVEPNPAWRERDFGALQGLAYDELFDRFPEYAVLDAGYTAATVQPAGGERWIDSRARALRAADELVAWLADDAARQPSATTGRTAVVVTHGGPIRDVLAAALDLDVAETILQLQPGNCSVTEFRVTEPVSLPPEPDDGVYSPAFPDATALERQSDQPEELAVVDAEG